MECPAWFYDLTPLQQTQLKDEIHGIDQFSHEAASQLQNWIGIESEDAILFLKWWTKYGREEYMRNLLEVGNIFLILTGVKYIWFAINLENKNK